MTNRIRRRMCEYCRSRKAVNLDHVVPKSLRHMHGPIPVELAGTVDSCFECNMRKGARRLVPASWEHMIPALTEAYPGTEWRVWRGSVTEDAYRLVHVG